MHGNKGQKNYRGGGNQREKKYTQRKIEIDKIHEWMTKGIDFDTDSFAHDFGNELAEEGLSKTQIRNVFGEVKRLEMKVQDKQPNESIRPDFVLLRSKFAYAIKRAESRYNKDMFARYKKVIWAAQEAVLKGSEEDYNVFRKRLIRFAQFFEAILAYHKVHGGRD